MASGIDPNALRAARERAGLTQHQLARLVGAAGGERVSRWELGASDPRPDFIVKLARALGIPTVRLIHLDGDTPDLRALRLKAGLTVPELAARTNMAVKTYYSWEVGRWTRLPPPAVIEALGQVFEEPSDAVAAAFTEAQRLRRRRSAEKRRSEPQN